MMDLLSEFLAVFLVGGILCTIGQVLISKTNLTTGRILAIFVVVGVFLTAIGIYPAIVEFGKAGATVPLTGFGYALANGVKSAVQEQGALGILTGGLTATAGGITAAIFFGFVNAVIFKPRTKK